MRQHKIQEKKLLHSKWTAVQPKNKEKHVMIVEMVYDDQQQLLHCIFEAVYSKRQQNIDWRMLKDNSKWKLGWC